MGWGGGGGRLSSCSLIVLFSKRAIENPALCLLAASLADGDTVCCGPLRLLLAPSFLLSALFPAGGEPLAPSLVRSFILHSSPSDLLEVTAEAFFLWSSFTVREREVMFLWKLMWKQRQERFTFREPTLPTYIRGAVGFREI